MISTSHTLTSTPLSNCIGRACAGPRRIASRCCCMRDPVNSTTGSVPMRYRGRHASSGALEYTMLLGASRWLCARGSQLYPYLSARHGALMGLLRYLPVEPVSQPTLYMSLTAKEREKVFADCIHPARRGLLRQPTRHPRARSHSAAASSITRHVSASTARHRRHRRHRRHGAARYGVETPCRGRGGGGRMQTWFDAEIQAG
ncbi:uncharacterized protein K452DRAFT_19608 [Aplosporella prunicola CBS 121167]|uniref:Uncharacterized protein n=1 Tax=Aplosporella prunicola CBS 121167 TaxID=1176127 RepID=A0A6A6BGT4_9PEZI|nr:uncharacterized protein K452DRAFT_19608 [Aplosporella prunicola CBS 121167]KAF2142484.1 hypothetical protein K452DRAFT_19608 [Aplosporella prunicola CBS 121167]